MDSVPGLGAKWIALPTHKADEKPMSDGAAITLYLPHAYDAQECPNRYLQTPFLRF